MTYQKILKKSHKIPNFIAFITKIVTYNNAHVKILNNLNYYTYTQFLLNVNYFVMVKNALSFGCHDKWFKKYKLNNTKKLEKNRLKTGLQFLCN